MTPGGTRDGTLPTTTSSASAAPTERTSGSKRPATEGGGGDHAAEAMQPAEGAGTTSSAGPSGEMKKGPWTAAEDAILMEYVREHGEGNWNAVQRNTGLSRCGKSCRLRWANHLRPNLKKGSFSPEEERLILQLHAQMGNKWARMAAQLPGRTDNEIKNYWNTRLKRRQRAGLPLYPPDIQRQAALHHPPTPPFFDLKAQVSAPMGNSPFNLFDRINLAGTTAAAETTRTTAVSNHLHLGHPHRPFLVPPPPAAASDHQSRVKRLRRDDVSVSLPFSTNPAPPPPPQASLFQYNRLWNYDPGPAPPLPPLPPPFTLQQRQSFSEKTELSSSQLYPELSRVAAGSDGVDNLPLERTNNDLLDALLSDTHQPVCSSSTSGWGGSGGDHNQRSFLMPELVSHDVRWVKAAMGNAHVAGTEPSRCMTLEPAGRCEDSNLPIDSKVKREPTHEKMGCIEDDVSALLDAIPMAMFPMSAPPSTAVAQRDWVASDSGEGSHGQSSAVTDEVELEMQQLASSLSMAPDEDYRSWGIGPSNWDSKRPGSGIR